MIVLREQDTEASSIRRCTALMYLDDALTTVLYILLASKYGSVLIRRANKSSGFQYSLRFVCTRYGEAIVLLPL